MNKSSIILIAAFFGIISLISFSVYSGIIEIKKPQNFLGFIGGSSDNFKFVGSVDLEDGLLIQNSDTISENNKKEASAPTKTKKDKKLNQPVVKVISGAVIKSNNDINSSVIIATATAPIISPTPLLALSVITTTSLVENLAPVQIQEKNPEKTQEQNLAQIPQIIQEPAPEQPQTQNQTQNSVSPTQNNQNNIAANILISEIMAGVDANSSYEFIEFFNPTANLIDLTGWSIKKKSSTGSESTLVSASRFEGKIIPANKYFLLVNEGGYNGSVAPDIFWPKSYTLAYANNAIIIYNANSELVEEVGWSEIPKDQSIERESFGNNQFKIQSNPNPQNSISY